jgi:uncharacterized membrane protein YccC
MLWVWIAIGVGVVLALVLALVVIGTPTRRLEARRERAADLRREAEERLASAARREVVARQEEARSQSERIAGEQALRRADAVDPDIPDAASEGGNRATVT